MQHIGRPQRKRRLPVVLSAEEVARVLGSLDGEHRLLAQLLYGTGLRIAETLQLRIKDLDFEHRTLIFFAILLALALVTFAAVQRLAPMP